MDWTITSDALTVTFTQNGVGRTFPKNELSLELAGDVLHIYNHRNGVYAKDYVVINWNDVASPSVSSGADFKAQMEAIIASTGGDASGYLIYRALLTQSSTGAPTAIVLENTLGEVPTFTYDNVGTYTIITVGNVFTANKTHVLLSCSAADISDWLSLSYKLGGPTALEIASFRNGALADDAMNFASIQILVYP